jgi:UDP-N-acetylglucosamine--N-acetylmuramyl-(pentapeptide) pyrophosphoryl-undecaprenol N-acetylglucosamine transferase
MSECKVRGVYMKILIVAGGTGGHILPALTLAREIKARNVGEVLFVISSKKQDSDIISGKGIDFKTLDITPLQSRSPFGLLKFLIKLFLGTIESIFMLLEFRPDAVVGFGGYVSGPMVLLASFSGIKSIIHEQNVYPGKANRILARFADKIAISFSETRQYLKGHGSKIILSGNPLREGLKRDERVKPSEIFNVLIIGGSQGAHKLNTIVPEAIGLMQDRERAMFNIIHIAGKDEKEYVEKTYKEIGIKNRVFSFTEHMARFYNECDFVISRSGAMTVSELLALAIPAIMVPYPYAGGHQRHNAMALEKTGSGIILEEKDLTPSIMRDAILKLMDRNILAAMSTRAKNIEKPDACRALINEIIND